MDNPTLALLRLAFSDLPRDPILPGPEDRIHAAVSLVLRGREDQVPELLLIKRSEHPADPWSGHMALPGGRLEPKDDHLLATAVRETLEETGVRLSDTPGERFLGHLPRVAPDSRQIPRVAVTPHLFTAEPGVQARPDSREVERVRWVPLDVLLRDGTRGEVEIHFSGGSRRFPCFRVEEDRVWGLTYRILEDFLRRLGTRGSGG